MKKRTEKNTAKRKGIFNKLGMTYIELICALALLSLIVVMFTPMLLSSYEQLYNAGEKISEIYDDKKEIEEGLARRDSALSVNFSMNLMGVNADILFENINVMGRKIVSRSNRRPWYEQFKNIMINYSKMLLLMIQIQKQKKKRKKQKK